MSDKKISELTAATTRLATDDKIPFTDTSASATKSITGALLGRSVTDLTIAASAVTPDLDLGEKFQVTLTESITVNAPTNPVDGDRLFIRFIQDATGSWTVTLNAVFAEGDDVAFSSLTTAASKTSKVTWEYDANLTKWTLLQLLNGF